MFLTLTAGKLPTLDSVLINLSTNIEKHLAQNLYFSKMQHLF
jgi:hypothetical protein